MKKLNAFTLAEVLITLGIIGVVAAMTLPTLIQNHQKQVYATQLKKSINVLGNMLNQMKADEGVTELDQTELFGNALCSPDTNACEVSTGNIYADYSKIEETIAKYLKTVKICKSGTCNISYKQGKYTIKGKNGITPCPESSQELSYIQTKSLGFYSVDGAIYYIRAYEYDSLRIDIDVNGEKGPNIAGRDLFSVKIFSSEGVVPAYTDKCSTHLFENNFTMDY